MNAARYLSLRHLHPPPHMHRGACVLALSLHNKIKQWFPDIVDLMASGRRISARRRARVGSAWVARGCAALAGNCLKRNYKTQAVPLPTLCHPPSLETTKRGREQEVS